MNKLSLPGPTWAHLLPFFHRCHQAANSHQAAKGKACGCESGPAVGLGAHGRATPEVISSLPSRLSHEQQRSPRVRQ